MTDRFRNTRASTRYDDSVNEVATPRRESKQKLRHDPFLRRISSNIEREEIVTQSYNEEEVGYPRYEQLVTPVPGVSCNRSARE